MSQIIRNKIIGGIFMSSTKKEFSFDIVSHVNLQDIDDSVNVSVKEINNRFDLKGSGSVIEFDRDKAVITLVSQSEFQLEQIKQILISKLAKRNISPKVLKADNRENALGGKVREVNSIIRGIDKELAKKIVKDIKDTKLKVQASIQEDKIRVLGKSKDELQEIIGFLKSKEYSAPLQFENYR